MTDANKNNDQNSNLTANVFTRWILTKLKGVSNSNFTDVRKDLSSGVTLVELAQILTRKKSPRPWDENPTTSAQYVKNCKLAFRMFRNDGFKPIGITSKNISDNNEKQILEYVWQLISFYTINKSFSKLDKAKENVSEANIKNKLLSWAIRRTQNYKKVFAFKPYDIAICALLDSYYPSKINYYVLDLKDRINNFKHAIDVMNELGIPCLILPEDFTQNSNDVDKKALLTQLAYVRIYLEVKQRSKPKKIAVSVLQQKTDSKPQNLSKTINKKVDLNHSHLLRTHIPIRKAKSELKTKKDYTSYPHILRNPKQPNDNSNNDVFNKEDEENSMISAKEQQKIENEIVEGFNEDKEAYEKRKLEDQKEIKKEEKHEKQIEAEISKEFKENKEAYKERKEEEKEEKENSRQLTKEQQKIEQVIANDFKENREENQKRKEEEKAEKDKLEREELKREGIKPNLDRRPTFINIV